MYSLLRPRRVSAALVVAALAVAAPALSDRLPPFGSSTPDRTTAQPPPPGPVPEAPTGVGDVARLAPPIRRSIQLAIEAARADGITLRVTSGWRSREHQARLFEAAVAKYGSRALARRWVLPPDESAHVRGEAVDVGPPAAAEWLARHGVRFGLCRRYANEPWHFERLAGAKGSSCPAAEPHA